MWGLYLAVQVPDGAWMKDRGLPDGNTYSHESGRKHLAAGMPADNSDWNKFMDRSRQANPEAWWRANLDLPAYYSFHAINRVVSNVDLRHGGNHYFYHHPDGHWAPLPWDLDMMFIPKTHWPGIIDQTRCLDLPVLRREYQNRAREILDLLCSDPAPDGGQFGQLVAECARPLRPAGHERSWPELDMAMWNHHPRTSDKGAFYRNPASQGMMGGGFERRLATPDFAGFCRFLTEFATDSRPTKNYQPNDGDVRGYGYGFLWRESKDDAIPTRPTNKEIASTAKNGAREFETTPFATATPAAQFAALQWRVGRFTAPGLPGYRDGKPWRYEIEPHWLSDELTVPVLRTSIPASVFKSPGTYRVRVRHRDTTGRWSHWSAPAQITVPEAGEATACRLFASATEFCRRIWGRGLVALRFVCGVASLCPSSPCVLLGGSVRTMRRSRLGPCHLGGDGLERPFDGGFEALVDDFKNVLRMLVARDGERRFADDFERDCTVAEMHADDFVPRHRARRFAGAEQRDFAVVQAQNFPPQRIRTAIDGQDHEAGVRGPTVEMEEVAVVAVTTPRAGLPVGAAHAVIVVGEVLHQWLQGVEHLLVQTLDRGLDAERGAGRDDFFEPFGCVAFPDSDGLLHDELARDAGRFALGAEDLPVRMADAGGE